MNSTAWKLFVELRKEIIEFQKLRSQTIGYKITFVSASVALIGANLSAIPTYLLAVPAIASIFFDILISSYSRSIRRIANYQIVHLEPLIRTETRWPNDKMLWLEFLTSKPISKHLPVVSHLGITSLVCIIGIIAAWFPYTWYISFPVTGAIISFFTYDVKVTMNSARALIRPAQPVAGEGPGQSCHL